MADDFFKLCVSVHVQFLRIDFSCIKSPVIKNTVVSLSIGLYWTYDGLLPTEMSSYYRRKYQMHYSYVMSSPRKTS